MNISYSYEFSRNDIVFYVFFKDFLILKDVCEWLMDYNIKGVYFVGIYLYKIRSLFFLKEILINLILNKFNLFIFKDFYCFYGKWIDIF